MQPDYTEAQPSIHHSPPEAKKETLPNHQSPPSLKPQVKPTQLDRGSPRLYPPSKEERDLINQAGNLSKEEIWEKLEQKRFDQLKKAAVNLQSEMIFAHRCPKCTLPPPCKHYQNSSEIIQEGAQLVQQPQFKQHLSPKQRESIIKTLKEHQRQNSIHANQDMMLMNQSQLSNEQQHYSQHKENNTNAFLTQLDQESLYQQQPHITTMGHDSQRHVINRNQFNNTVTGGMLSGRGGGNQSNMRPSNLSQYGSNIMASQLNRKQYLRKRQGNGGSPVEYNTGYQESSKLEGPLQPKDRQGGQRDRTTVRIRTKNNQYTYGEASFSHPLQTTKNAHHEQSKQQQSFLETSQLSLYEKEKLQAVIAKYKEDKIQRQIEKIEYERSQIDLEKKLQRDLELKRQKYIELQRQKLYEHQVLKQKEEDEQKELERLEQGMVQMRERMRREYYERQRKNISEYKEQKRRTDEILMIPGVKREPAGVKHAKKDAQFPPPSHYYAPVYNKGMITKAGQQFVSGGGSIQNAQKIRAEQYQQNLHPETHQEDDEFDMYYQEQEFDLMTPETQQQRPEQVQQQQHFPITKQSLPKQDGCHTSNLLHIQDGIYSTGIIGEHQQLSMSQTKPIYQEKEEQTGIGGKRDSLDMLGGADLDD